jgi:hypothetical protein
MNVTPNPSEEKSNHRHGDTEKTAKKPSTGQPHLNQEKEIDRRGRREESEEARRDRIEGQMTRNQKQRKSLAAEALALFLLKRIKGRQLEGKASRVRA